MLKIIDIDYIRDYELKVCFNNGVTKIVDLRPHLQGEVFGELLEHKQFIQYALTPYTIEWANGADLAPEFLYEIGVLATSPADYLFENSESNTHCAES